VPVVETTAFSTASDAFSFIRSLVNDADIPQITTIPQTGANRTSGVVTITTSLPHNLQIGSVVQVGSVTDGSFNQSATVTSIPTTTTFTYSQVGGPNTISGNGTVSQIIQGDTFQDAVLLPFVNAGYRKLQRRMRASGSKSLTGEIIISGFPALATDLTDATFPALPVDFVAPREIFERISGNQFFNLYPMGIVDSLPSTAQQAYNGIYSWREDGIYFTGSFNNTDLLLRYFKGQQRLTDGTSPILIRNGLDPVSYWGAFLAAQSRSPAAGINFKSLFEEAMSEFLATQAGARQYQPSRRGRYNQNSSSGRGCRGW
jgi:hypothetical protein